MLLLVDADRHGQLRSCRNRRWVRLVARLLASSLDRQLAAGCPPEASRLLAARASVLVSATMRLGLARDLAHVIELAHRTPAPRSPRTPLNRDGIAACAPELQRALHTLPRPVADAGTGQRDDQLASPERDGPALWNRPII